MPFLEGLVTDYPEVIDYYLHDGQDRLKGMIADLRDLARLPPSATGAAVEPGDLTGRLAPFSRPSTVRTPTTGTTLK